MTTATLELSDEEMAVIVTMRAAAKKAALDAGEVAVGAKPSGNVRPLKRTIDHTI